MPLASLFLKKQNKVHFNYFAVLNVCDVGLPREAIGHCSEWVWTAVSVTKGFPDTSAVRKHYVVPGVRNVTAFRSMGGKGSLVITSCLIIKQAIRVGYLYYCT